MGGSLAYTVAEPPAIKSTKTQSIQHEHAMRINTSDNSHWHDPPPLGVGRSRLLASKRVAADCVRCWPGLVTLPLNAAKLDAGR